MALIHLTRVQLVNLHDAILAAFPQMPVFDSLLWTELKKRLDVITTVGHPFDVRIYEMIDRAQAEFWLSDLLVSLTAAQPANPEFARLRKELQPLLPAPAIDYYESCRLIGEHVMIDRRQFREGLRRLQCVNGKCKRILVVRGAPKSGKSHSMMLIAYLRDLFNNFKFVPVDLEQIALGLGNAGSIHAEHIGLKIVSRMKGYEAAKLPPPSDAQRSKWVLDFCDEIEKIAVDDQTMWWIVIDAFQKVLIAQSAYDLVKELCLRINLTLSRFRLVLLDFPETLDSNVTPNVEQEIIGTIGKDEVRDFFITTLQGTPSENDPVAIARAVAATLAAGGNDLTLLGRAASDELKRF